MSMQLILTAKEGGMAGREFRFSGPTQCLVGRSHACTLRLGNDYTVSRTHCLLDLGPNGATVCDLGSMNGTFVNGEKLGAVCRANNTAGATEVVPAPRRLADGDELRVGFTAFRIGVVAVENEPDRRARPGHGVRWMAVCA
jgi:pSer/pThr/pTyr-binding forkhead associated (FHA) protein